MRDNVFSSTLGEDYQLLKFSYPHHDEFQKTVADEVAKHFAESDLKAVRVLEGGAGSGVTTSFLLEADSRIQVCAVDSAAAMLAQAKTILTDGINRVSLIESDLLTYARQQPDDSFDVFVAVWTLHNLPPEYRKDLFSEISRILRPGGLFVSGDKYTVDDITVHEQQLKIQLQRFKDFPTNNPKVVDAWVSHNIEDEEIRISEKEQVELLEQVGLADVKVVYRQDMEAVIIATN